MHQTTRNSSVRVDRTKCSFLYFTGVELKLNRGLKHVKITLIRLLIDTMSTVLGLSRSDGFMLLFDDSAEEFSSIIYILQYFKQNLTLVEKKNLSSLEFLNK